MKTHIIYRWRCPEFHGRRCTLCEMKTSPWWFLDVKEDITQEEIDKCTCKKCLNIIKKNPNFTLNWQKENNLTP
jgi:hypothetical protein